MKGIRMMLCALLCAAIETMAGTLVDFITPVGTIRVELHDEDKPQTVANFLAYLDSGRFDSVLIHRLVQGFVVQGGGFYVDRTNPSAPTFAAVETDAPVPNEYADNTVYSNVYGTLAISRPDGYCSRQ